MFHQHFVLCLRFLHLPTNHVMSSFFFYLHFPCSCNTIFCILCIFTFVLPDVHLSGMMSMDSRQNNIFHPISVHVTIININISALASPTPYCPQINVVYLLDQGIQMFQQQDKRSNKINDGTLVMSACNYNPHGSIYWMQTFIKLILATKRLTEWWWPGCLHSASVNYQENCLNHHCCQ